jgi:hypothetical protein
VVADATYGNGEFLQWLMERGITPYMRTRDSALRKNNPLYGPERFTYLPESNSYRCPAGQQLNYVGLNVRNRAHAYIGSRKRCGACSQKAQCTTGQYKYLAIHIHEPSRQRARDLANTPGFASAQRFAPREARKRPAKSPSFPCPSRLFATQFFQLTSFTSQSTLGAILFAILLSVPFCQLPREFTERASER